jgi:hypothetical protein
MPIKEHRHAPEAAIMKHKAITRMIHATFLLVLSALLLQGQAIAVPPVDAVPVDI